MEPTQPPNRRQKDVEINGEALRALILKDGYSISEFARQIEMTPSHLSNVLAARRGCKPSTVKRMAEVLQVPVSAILWRKDAVA